VKEIMQNIKIAPTFFIIKNVVKIKNVKKRKKRDINIKRKKRFFYICACKCPTATVADDECTIL